MWLLANKPGNTREKYRGFLFLLERTVFRALTENVVLLFVSVDYHLFPRGDVNMGAPELFLVGFPLLDERSIVFPGTRIVGVFGFRLEQLPTSSQDHLFKFGFNQICTRAGIHGKGPKSKACTAHKRV